MDIKGRSAIVAGGAGGLGGAVVRRLVAAGAAVVVLDPDHDRASALVAEVGPNVATVEGDSNDDEAVGRAVASAQGFAPFSIAISATGVVIPSHPLVDADGSVLSKDVLRANLDLHVTGPFNLARLSAAAFLANDPDGDGQRGVIVQTASISAFDGQRTMVPYAAAKGAIVSMTLPMARDLAPYGIRVCTVAPGAFLTPRLSSPAVQELLVRDVAFPKRVGDPDEFASMVEQIVTNPYVNGEVVRIDGGARLGPAMGWR
jgi:3-hydroxyacyl-CoA dehydrogenase / 3-hydroxy-2-methylbutyryl-CoA dehydrogenase